MGSLQCKTCSLRLLVVMAMLGLSLLLNVLQAVPVSRTRDLADRKNYMAIGDTDDQQKCQSEINHSPEMFLSQARVQRPARRHRCVPWIISPTGSRWPAKIVNHAGFLAIKMGQSPASLGEMIEEDMWEQGTDEQFIHGRMDFQGNDYPGSGANNKHDGGPKTPGKNVTP